tara:strand:- start:350 stop:634 length:285 start_codon:yes stop_codon:yes gene_type:complete
MDCLNFTKGGNKFIFHSSDYSKFKENGERIIHWLPKTDLVKVEVLMPDNKLVKGLGEKGLKGVKVGTVIQFNRFGFCRLDNKKKDKITFWYAHD